MEAKDYVKYNEDQYRFEDIGDKRDSGRKQSIRSSIAEYLIFLVQYKAKW